MSIHYDREEQAKIEVGHTAISGNLARILILIFFVVICFVPVWQLGHELRQKTGGQGTEVLPSFIGFFSHTTNALKASPGSDPQAGSFQKLLDLNERLLGAIVRYEDLLEENSRFRSSIIPPSQHFFTGVFGLGNENTIIGRDGWLFFEPGIRYLTASMAQMTTTVNRGASKANTVFLEERPGPRDSILDFARQLAERDIQLVLLPIPVKPMFYPQYLSGRVAGRKTDQFPTQGYLQHPAFDALVTELKSKDILVFDAADYLQQHRNRLSTPLFLMGDTHWSPEAAGLVAEGLAAFIEEHKSLSLYNQHSLQTLQTTVKNTGDIANMLPLPADHRLLQAESVELTQVLQNANEPWMADPEAEILFLGDSFANIYSHPAMGWGESAGLVELLSWHSGRPVDRIVQNDNAAFATRMALAHELSRGRDRLAGKSVLIWQFAVRELLVGDWRHIALVHGEARETSFFTPQDGQTAIITGTIRQASSRPVPRTTPYRDHIMSLHLVDVSVEGLDAQEFSALVYAHSMTDFEPEAISSYRPGQEIRLVVHNWYDVIDSYGSINRSEIDDYDLLFEDPVWASEVLQ